MLLFDVVDLSSPKGFPVPIYVNPSIYSCDVTYCEWKKCKRVRERAYGMSISFTNSNHLNSWRIKSLWQKLNLTIIALVNKAEIPKKKYNNIIIMDLNIVVFFGVNSYDLSS